MRKLFFILICLCFVNIVHISAQWEDISSLSNSTTTRNGSSFKETVIISDFYNVYLSFNKGNTWRKIQNIPNYIAGSTQPFKLVGAVDVNDDGIFIQKNDSIYFSSNQGISWDVKSINIGTPATNELEYNEFVTNDSFRYLARRQIRQYYTIYTSPKSKNTWQIDKRFPEGVRGIKAYKNKIACVTKDSFYIANINTTTFKWTSYKFPTKDISLSDYSFMPISIDDNRIIVTAHNYGGYPIRKQEVYMSNTSGATWSLLNILPDSSEAINCITFKNKIYIKGKDVYSSDDNGLNWTTANNGIKGLLNGWVLPIDFFYNDSSLYIFTAVGAFYLNPNEGNKWQYRSINTLKGSFQSTILKMPNGNMLTGNLGLFYSNDEGNTWLPTENSTNIQLHNDVNRTVAFVKDSIIYAPGTYYVKNSQGFDETRYSTFISRNNALTWEREPNIPLFSASVIAGDTIFIATTAAISPTNSGQILFSKKYPYTTWEVFADNTYDNVMTYRNGFLYTANQNRSIINVYNAFTKQLTQSYNAYISGFTSFGYINFLATKNKVFFTPRSGMLASEDNGVTWTKKLRYPSGNTFFLSELPNGILLAGINSNGSGNDKVGIYASRDNGETWNIMNSGFKAQNKMFIYSSGFAYKNNIYLQLALNEPHNGWKRRSIDDFKLKQISGNIFLDKNNNGFKDFNEQALPNIIILNEFFNNVTISDKNGDYNLLADLNQKDTVRVKPFNKYAKITPPFYLYDTIANFDKNFGIYLPSNINDVSITLTDITPPRPGFSNTYDIIYTNQGSTIASGTIKMTFDPLVNKINALPKPTDSTSFSYSWRFDSLNTGEIRGLRVESKTPLTTKLGSIVKTIVQIDPIFKDTFLSDNIDSLAQAVVGSYDPNDKQVTFNNSKTSPSVIDPKTELIYTIRFQNTGNYPADFVKVVDTISDKLDISTFRVIANSHDFTASIRNKNVLIFDFNPIYLPDSVRDEKGSHGFIKFAIKPKKTLTKDEAIRNTGYIYFDYNPAIITNTVETANQKVNSILTPSVFTENLKIYPNPVNRSLNIEIEDEQFKEGFFNIYDISGRLILSQNVSNKLSVIDVSFLSVGEFICTIKSKDNKVFVSKFLKVD
jgi:uncharacterized repeat protein (TIGR01451 family)